MGVQEVNVGRGSERAVGPPRPQGHRHASSSSPRIKRSRHRGSRPIAARD
jgi:hypothetical protein